MRDSSFSDPVARLLKTNAQPESTSNSLANSEGGGMTPFGRLGMIVVAAAIWGCASAPATGPGSSDKFNVRLTAGPHNAGQIGEASFAAQGDATNIVLTLSGVPNQVTRPVNLYTYIYEGTCGNLSPKPVYSLNEVVLARATSGSSPGFTLDKLAPVPLQKLRSGGYAIAVRTQAPDLDQEMFCGNIK
jgi:hypothetical protein